MGINEALENRKEAIEFARTKIEVDSEEARIESWSSPESVRNDEDYKSEALKPYLVLAATSSGVDYNPQEVEELDSGEILDPDLLDDVYESLEDYEESYAKSFQMWREMSPQKARKAFSRNSKQSSEINPGSDHETSADETGNLGA